MAFTKSGERLVGDAAKRQAVTNSRNTIYSIKRFMGRKFRRSAGRNQAHALQGRRGFQRRRRGRSRSGRQTETILSAGNLRDDSRQAEEPMPKCVSARKSPKPSSPFPLTSTTRSARPRRTPGSIAGLEVLRIINEPTAASLAYGLDKKKDEKIAVYDLGGGTFDISVLEIGDGVFEVKATNGDTHLGGDDWDNRLMDWILDEFKKEQGMDLRKQPDALQRIKEEAEKAKIALSSSAQQYEINLPFITADASGPKHISMKLTRAKMEQLCDDLFERTIGPVKACLERRRHRSRED